MFNIAGMTCRMIRARTPVVAVLPELWYWNKKSRPFGQLFIRRGGQIRTDDLLLPKQARYRATLRPERAAKER